MTLVGHGETFAGRVRRRAISLTGRGNAILDCVAEAYGCSREELLSRKASGNEARSRRDSANDRTRKRPESDVQIQACSAKAQMYKVKIRPHLSDLLLAYPLKRSVVVKAR